MRNFMLSYPKSGKNRIELLCLLYLTKYIGTDSPLGWNWLKYWCRFTHFGFHNINIPDNPDPMNIPIFPRGSTINILQRNSIAVLCSMYRWYQEFPPEADVFKAQMQGGMTLDEFALSEWGLGRLQGWNSRLQLLRAMAQEREYQLRYYRYEGSFNSQFVHFSLPEILNLTFRLAKDESEWIIRHSSVEYVRGLLAGADRPAEITPDIISGLKIGMRGGHIQIGDPDGHKGQMAPETEKIIAEQLQRQL